MDRGGEDDRRRRELDRGRVAFVSPLRDDLPSTVDAHWYPIRPATDTALMLALARTLVAEGLHDLDFLDRYCVGYPAFERYLLDKDPVWAAEITGIPAAGIVAPAREMAAHRTLITVTWSLQRTDCGHPVVAAVAGLRGTARRRRRRTIHRPGPGSSGLATTDREREPMIELLPVTSWPRLRGRRLGLSVLAEGQDEACLRLSARQGDRFRDVGWEPGPHGSVFISGSST
ncbi:hypothetical protein [Amycolatopsis sp. NPDC051102]|uniref:hypothetical protein n=1 Tax=Amycolatopsis sp. NPDC051102 TaxID=3155163 RepID=UPI003415C3AA